MCRFPTHALRSALPGLVALCLVPLGCRQQSAQEKESIPTASSSSVALPGSNVAADAPRAPAVAESSRGDLTAYTDSETGVRFTYPSDWRPWHAGSPMYLPSVAGEAAGPPRITEVFTPGPTWKKTNLTGLSFAYTARKDFSAEQCERVGSAPSTAASPSEETIHDVTYRRTETSDAGMCHAVQTVVDTAVHRDICYIFERHLQTICPGVRGPGDPVALTDTQRKSLEDVLASVMNSVTLQ